jgi:hypothetical protein
MDWTTDKEELNYDYYWGDDYSDGQVMIKEHGLGSPQPIMRNTPESGDCLYMFRCGSKYYIWNLIEDDVWEIQAPLDLEDIIAKIAKLGFGALNAVMVPQVSTSD